MKPNDTSPHYLLSSSPHAHAPVSVSRVMLDVVLALIPTTIAGCVFFGLPAVWTVLVCVGSAVVTEALCRRAMGREQTVGDLSAVLTGLLLALNLPAGLPLWMAALGSVFAIAIAKQVFGGLGMNPFNPALAARAFLLVSFAGPMTTWLKPFWWRTPEAMTTATPLAAMKTMSAGAEAASTTLPGLGDLFLGTMPGCIGEVSAAALLLGAAYLLVRRVITWHIPVSFLATCAVCAWIMGGAPVLTQLLTGGVVLGACFMATDYVTSPTTAKGRLIFGCGCGLLCMLIRRYGAYPEGCSFSILVMNAFAPLISRWTKPKPFGAK